MTTYSLNPTYYQVTWTLNSPTDYSGLTGDQSGGLDSTTAADYNRTITVTGTASLSGNPLSNGSTISVNGTTITFTGSDTLSTIISKINLVSKFSGVIADQRVASGYITLASSCGYEGKSFYIADGGQGALSTLGFTAGTYAAFPSIIGSSYSNVTTGSNVTINGVNIVFTSGNIASAVAQINAYTPSTSVVAQAAGTSLQLSSVFGQPFVINSGNAVSNLGIGTGNFGGYPTTLLASQAKERANARWTLTLAQLESFSTPSFVGNIVRTGDVTGNSAPTTFTFTVGYDHPAQVSTVATASEPDAGTVFTGADAIKRAVARALTSTFSGNRKVFDPTIQNYGANANRANPVAIQKLTTAQLDTTANINTLANNLTVVQISGI